MHPVADPAVMAGNGTIGLEILEDLPDLDAVVIPYGGGGLTVGIASAIRALRPQTQIFTAEPETGAALVAALAAGHRSTSTTAPSFVDGSGSRRVLDSMWPRVPPLIDDALVVQIAETAAAVRTLAERAARDRRGRRRAGHRRRAGRAGPAAEASSRSSPAATSTWPSWPRSSKEALVTDGTRRRLRAPVLPGPGASDYERYLRTDELLSLQKTAEEWAHRDELLFQTVHQTSELWLKFASTEVEEAAACSSAAIEPALRLLRRAVLCLEYVTTQLEMLEQMSPWEYQQIRVVLGHGSGFDSPGFRARRGRDPARRPGVRRAARRAGLDLVELYQRGRELEQLYQLAEPLTDWDERIWVWRFRHYAVVARTSARTPWARRARRCRCSAS